MTPTEFGQQIERLTRAFGQGFYNKERTDLIWRVVGELEAKWLSKIVDQMIASFRQAPLPNDFREVAQREKSKRLDFEIQSVASPAHESGLGDLLKKAGAKDLNEWVRRESSKKNCQIAALRFKAKLESEKSDPNVHKLSKPKEV